MQFLPDVLVRCPECRGTRYRPEILEITYRGRNIAEVLDLTAREAFVLLPAPPAVQARLRPLLELGSTTCASASRPRPFPAARPSGSSSRASWPLAGRPCTRAGRPAHTLFLLDEPTTGLHPADILKLLEALAPWSSGATR